MSNLFLPDDIVLLIIEQIHRSALVALGDLCLVSIQFCKLVTPIIYRSTELAPAQLRSQGNSSYSFQANVIAYARELTIQAPLDWEYVADLLSRMRRLDSIWWRLQDEPFPNSLIHLLRTRWPDCKLYIETLSIGNLSENGRNADQDQQILDHLLGCQNIHSVKATFSSRRQEIASRFNEFLISCPRLEILHITKSRHWPVEFGFLPEFGSLPGVQLPPVKELVLEISTIRPRPTSFWNLSKLRYLEVRGHCALAFFFQLQNPSNCVETLIVEQYRMPGRSDRNVDALSRFISSAKGIENLTIRDTMNQIPAHTFCLHGRTLQSLSLHQPRQGPSLPIATNAPYYSADDFKMLNRCCPHLSSMTLDIKFPEPREYLIALAQFPSLKSLRLLGGFNETAPHHDYEWPGARAHPHIKTDTLTVQRIFAYFQKYKVGAKFENLEVIFGEFPTDSLPEDLRLLNKNCDRPVIVFTYRISDQGDVLVENSSTEADFEKFEYYFSDSNLTDSKPGYSYLEGFMEWNQAGDEADSVMNDKTDEGNDEDVDSLFGDEKIALVEGLEIL